MRYTNLIFLIIFLINLSIVNADDNWKQVELDDIVYKIPTDWTELQDESENQLLSEKLEEAGDMYKDFYMITLYPLVEDGYDENTDISIMVMQLAYPYKLSESSKEDTFNGFIKGMKSSGIEEVYVIDSSSNYGSFKGIPSVTTNATIGVYDTQMKIIMTIIGDGNRLHQITYSSLEPTFEKYLSTYNKLINSYEITKPRPIPTTNVMWFKWGYLLGILIPSLFFIFMGIMMIIGIRKEFTTKRNIKDYFLRLWTTGFKINIVSILSVIAFMIMIGIFYLVYTSNPNALIILVPLGIITCFAFLFPLTGFLFNKLIFKNQKLNTFSEYWKIGWESCFIIGILGWLAFPIMIITGLIYYFLNLVIPYFISTVLFLGMLLLLIPFVEGYYYNRWIVEEKIHRGSTINRNFFRTYIKPILLLVMVYLLMSMYEASKQQTEVDIPYLFGTIIGLFIVSLIGFFVYDLIERKINKTRHT
jgi:hypothetical protein